MKPNSQTRRSFLLTSLGAATAGVASAATAATPRKKIALLATSVYVHSHAQHFIDRFALGYAWNGEWHRPEVELVSLYVDQFSERDLARDRAKRHGVPIHKTIAEALTLGTGKLAVDGVVIIAEHGDYPKNDRGQILYPRYEFFKEVVKVFEASGRSVPVFNDKHLSTDWKKCVEMVEDSKRLNFPFHAGSSLPVTRRLPAIDLPSGTPLAESVCAGYGPVEVYDFHGFETAQCMSERRRGGETGIRSVLALQGEKMWRHAAKREQTKRLLVAALIRSHTLPAVEGYPTDAISFDWARSAFPDGLAYFVEHRDGFRTTLFMLKIRDFNYAGLNAETGAVTSCQMFLPMPGSSATTADFFNPLVHHIERMVIERRVPYPVERTLLTSGMVIAGVESLHRDGMPIETPEMEVRYTVPDESFFWRE